MTKTIIVTGVHHTPAIELFRLLSEDKANIWKIVYLTRQEIKDTHISHTIKHLKIDVHPIITSKYDRRKRLLSLILAPINLLGIVQSLYYLVRYQPSLVVSFGGYASFPVVFASWLARRPVIVHEQTLTISLALKLSAPFATKIALSLNHPSFTNHLPPSKIVVTGNLLRHQIYSTATTNFSSLTSSLKRFPLIYITGGSQGSQFINNLVWHSLPHLTKYLIIHQTGKYLPPAEAKQYSNYISREYIELADIGWILNHAGLIISRSGANITQEIQALQKPAIIIPHPFTQQNEQKLNALWLKEHNRQQVIILNQDNSLTPNLLKATIDQFLLKPQVSIKPPRISFQVHPFVKLINEIG